jgi:hypothetical protein
MTTPEDAIGDGDLYVSFRRDGAWTAPRPVPVNTEAREYCPIVSPDGTSLYFTSESGFPDDMPQSRLNARASIARGAACAMDSAMCIASRSTS